MHQNDRAHNRQTQQQLATDASQTARRKNTNRGNQGSGYKEKPYVGLRPEQRGSNSTQ
jgi:hypothetical protein